MSVLRRSYNHMKIPALTLLVGLGLGFVWANQMAKPEPSELRQVANSTGLTSPLLLCEESGESISRELGDIKPAVERLVRQAVSRGDITHASVYFRDLNNGPWFGINEREEFRPASLLKVPLMMSYYKLAETNPGILGKRLKFEKEYIETLQFDSVVPPAKSAEVGKTYSIEELIDLAILYSDNQATGLLLQNLSEDQLRSTYRDLHIEDLLGPSSNGLVNIKEYTGFFRILYNSSYLSRSYSEKALDKLTQATYQDGLSAGVPGEIKVAHKFGESRTVDGEFQFHDCGIVYHPDKPYLICVMTRGSDLARLQKIIASVSEAVYQEVRRNIE